VVKVKLSLGQARKAQSGGEVYSTPSLTSALKGWVVKAMPQLISLREREPVPIVQEAGCTPGYIWMGAENLTSTRV